MKSKFNATAIFIFVLVFSNCAAKNTVAADQTPKETTTPTPAPTPSEVSITPTPVSSEKPSEIDSPVKVIQKYTEELKEMAGTRAQTEKGKRDTSKEAKIAEKVRSFFDFETLAKLSLGRHWSRISKEQQEEFTRLFVDLVEDSYLRRSRDLVGAYNLTYGKEVVQNGKAKVTCKVARDDADVTITYELHRNPENWMIYNIILDDVDLVRNYQTQFNRIIEKASFNGLLRRMRKKMRQQDTAVDGTSL